MAFENPIASILRTAASGLRVEIANFADGVITGSMIRFFTGTAAELAGTAGPGMIRVEAPGGPSVPSDLIVQTPQDSAIARPGTLTLVGDSADGTVPGSASLNQFTDLLRGLRIGGAISGTPRAIKQLDLGDSGSINVAGGGGQITVPHALGQVPSLVFWADLQTNQPYRGFAPTPAAMGGGSFPITFRDDTNTLAPNGTPLRGYWLAIKL